MKNDIEGLEGKGRGNQQSTAGGNNITQGLFDEYIKSGNTRDRKEMKLSFYRCRN